MVLLPFNLRLFREPICKIVCFEQCVCLESGQCVSQKPFCQSIVLSRYHFAKIPFCQSIVLLKYHFAKVLFCQNMAMPNVYRTFPGADACIDSYIEVFSIPLHLRIILRGFHQVASQGRWFHWNPVSGLSVSLRQWISKKTPKTK